MQTKALLLTLFMSFASIMATAQTFSLSPANVIETTYNVSDFASDYIYVNNHSGALLNLSFQTLTNTMSSVGWDLRLCTNKECYTYVPSSASLGLIANGDSTGYFDLRANFKGIAATGEVKIRVYETGNPTNADTITIIYHATTTAGILSNTSNPTFQLSQNYPNPFNTTTSVSYNLPTTNGTLIVTDLTGKVIKTIVLHEATGVTFINNEFTNGIYFYSIKNENGAIIATRKMVVD